MKPTNNSCVIIGGGYAGLATAIELKHLSYDGAVTLYDSRKNHQKITQWHKLARGKRAQDYEVPFEKLAAKFGFIFEHKNIDLANLSQFDTANLVIAQGAHTVAKPDGVLTLDDLRDDVAKQELVRAMENQHVVIIGGGPTGVQFAFEFAGRGNRVDLFEARDRLLPTFDYALGQTAERIAQANGIITHTNTSFLRYQDGRVIAQRGKSEVNMAADHVLFVPGVRATPAFDCDDSGHAQVSGGRAVFAVGDNSYYSGTGLNAKSAQAAVRKGQCVARAIVFGRSGKPIPAYHYQELGYFVSLGPHSAVGYLLSQKTAFSGAPALFMKEIIEKQYDLFLAGFNVYL